jgi:hypothetical protein
MASGESAAVLITEALPVMFPAVVGVNARLKLALCPAANVMGNAGPVALNVLGLTLSCEMVTFTVPAFDSITLCVLSLPTETLPKVSAVGLDDNWLVAACPVPLREIAVGEPGALLTSTMLLVWLPVEVGRKFTVNDEDFPGATVNGNPRPVMPNPVPGPAD